MASVHCICSNASRGLSATAECLVHTVPVGNIIALLLSGLGLGLEVCGLGLSLEITSRMRPDSSLYFTRFVVL